MPTRKQKRREQKAKRHDYEIVYLDAEGNELDEVPEETERPKKERASSSTGKKQQRGGRAGREPQPPSWRRSFRRAGLLGIVVFLFFSLSGPKGNGRYLNALAFSVLYTGLFVPFTYAIDRFAYRRWQARQPGASPAVKKR
jgi:hypothetical protein